MAYIKALRGHGQIVKQELRTPLCGNNEDIESLQAELMRKQFPSP
jgi:hypothetical protein